MERRGGRKKGAPTQRGGRARRGDGRRPGGRATPLSVAHAPPPRLRGAKLGRGTPALQSLDEYSKPLYERWLEDTKPVQTPGRGGSEAPALFNAKELAKLPLDHVAALMDCVAQSGRSTRAITIALQQLEQAASALIEGDHGGGAAAWSREGLLFTLSACGKAAVLATAQSMVMRLLPVLILRLPAPPGEPSAPTAFEPFELNPGELAMLVNRLSKFAEPFSGQGAFAELALVVDQLAAMVASQFDAQGRPHAPFTFKNFAQLANGFAKFRTSTPARNAIVPLAKAARAEMIKCGHPTVLDTDCDATGLSVINLCALVNGLAGFAGVRLTGFDAAEAADDAADEALCQAIEAAAALADGVKDWSTVGMPALAQLVHGFGRFSRVPAASAIVVKLATSVVERLSRDAAWREDPDYIKVIGMLAAGLGGVIAALPAMQRGQMKDAISLVSSYVPRRPRDLQWHRFDLLAYLLQGLAEFGSGGALEALTQAMRDQLLAEAQGRFALVGARPNLRALVMAADALCRLDLDHACVGVIGPLVDVIRLRIVPGGANVHFKQALTPRRLAQLIEALGVLSGRVAPGDRRRVERCIDSLVGCLATCGALELPLIAQVVRGLARQGGRKLCADATGVQLKTLVPLLAGIKSPAARDATMSCVGALARGLADCALWQSHVDNLAEAAGALERFVLDQAPAAWIPLGLSTLADAIDGLSHLLDAMPVHAQALWSLLHAVPVVWADKGVQSQAPAQAHATMALKLQRLKARVPSELQPVVATALAAMLSSVAEDLAERRLGGTAAIEVACSLCWPGSLGREEVRTLSRGLKPLIDSADVPGTVQGRAAKLRLLMCVAALDGLDDDIISTLPRAWITTSMALTAIFERELAAQELSSLARLAATLGWAARSTGAMANAARSLIVNIASALAAGADAWLSNCEPIEIVLALCGLARADAVNQLETLLLEALQWLSSDAAIAALSQADDADLVEWCHLLHDLARGGPSRDVGGSARRLLKEKVLPIAWKRLEQYHEAGASHQAPAPTSMVTLLHYVVLKSGQSTCRGWDERSVPKLSHEEAVAGRKLLRGQNAQIIQWLGKMSPIGVLDKLAWARIVEMERWVPTRSGVPLARLDAKAAALPVQAAAKFEWMQVFDELAKQAPTVPAQNVVIQPPVRCSLSWFSFTRPPRKPRYTVLQRLSQGQMKLLEVGLPAEVDAGFLEGVYVIDGVAHRLDVAGGGGKAYAVPLADTLPEASFSSLIQTLLPNVESSGCFASVLMQGGPEGLDGHGPGAHVLEGSFAMAVLPDQEPGSKGALALPDLALTVQTGLGFIKESVAKAWPWYQDAKKAGGSAVAPLFGGSEPEVGLSPDAMQHYPPNAEAASEIVGDLSKMSSDDAALQYQLLTQGRQGRGHRARTVPAADGKLHLSGAKRLGKGPLLLDAGVIDAPRLQAIDEADVAQGSATSQCLDGCVWIGYGLVVRDISRGDYSIFEGSLLVLPDAHWPAAYKDCTLLLPAGDERTRSTWRQGANPYSNPAQRKAAGVLVVREVGAPGSCVAVPPKRQRALGRDFGSEVFVIGGLTKLPTAVKPRSVQTAKPPQPYRSAFDGKTYEPARGPQIAASTRNLRTLYAEVLRRLRFLDKDRLEHFARFAMQELCCGLDPTMVSLLEQLVDADMPSPEVAQELARRIGEVVASSPPDGAKLWQALLADVDSKAKKAAKSDSDILALLLDRQEAPSDRHERLALWLHAMSRQAGPVPPEVYALFAKDQVPAALELLVRLGLLAGEDATQGEIDEMYRIGLALNELLSGEPTPPYGPQTQQIIVQGGFDVQRAVAARNALQSPCNMAAAVMKEAIGQAMDLAKLWNLKAPYKPPAVPTTARQPSAPQIEPEPIADLAMIVDYAIDALKGRQYAKELGMLTRLIRFSGKWTADALALDAVAELARLLAPRANEAVCNRFLETLTDLLCRLARHKKWDCPESPKSRAWLMGQLLRAAWPVLDAAKDVIAPRGVCYLLVELTPVVCPEIMGEEIDPWGALREYPRRCTVFYRLVAAMSVQPLKTPPMQPADAIRLLLNNKSGLRLACNMNPLMFVFQVQYMPGGKFTPQELNAFCMGMATHEPWYMAMTSAWGYRERGADAKTPVKPSEVAALDRMPLKVACELARQIMSAGVGRDEYDAALMDLACEISRGGLLGDFELSSLTSLVKQPRYNGFCGLLAIHGLVGNAVNILWFVRCTKGLPGVGLQDWRWMALDLIWELVQLDDVALNGAVYVDRRIGWLKKLQLFLLGQPVDSDDLVLQLTQELPVKAELDAAAREQVTAMRRSLLMSWWRTVLLSCVSPGRNRRPCIDLSRLTPSQIQWFAAADWVNVLGWAASEWQLVGSVEQRAAWANALRTEPASQSKGGKKQ